MELFTTRPTPPARYEGFVLLFFLLFLSSSALGIGVTPLDSSKTTVSGDAAYQVALTNLGASNRTVRIVPSDKDRLVLNYPENITLRPSRILGSPGKGRWIAVGKGRYLKPRVIRIIATMQQADAGEKREFKLRFYSRENSNNTSSTVQGGRAVEVVETSYSIKKVSPEKTEETPKDEKTGSEGVKWVSKGVEDVKNSFDQFLKDKAGNKPESGKEINKVTWFLLVTVILLSIYTWRLYSNPGRRKVREVDRPDI